jgi:hypothetical protein
MIVRLGLLVAASVAAFAVKQLNIKTSRPSTSAVKPSGTPFYEFRVFVFLYIDYICLCVCELCE